MKPTLQTMRLATAFPVLLALCELLTSCHQGAAPAPAAPPPAEVEVINLQPQSVNLKTELPGRTSPFLVSEIRPQVSGILQKRLFTEGTDVKAGQQLYQIDPSTYKASLDSAQASLNKAQANLVAAKSKAERYHELASIQAVSKQDLEDAQSALDQAQAEVDLAKAALQIAKINLAYTSVLAPISGRVAKSNITPGALVIANQETMLTNIQQLDPIYVDVTQSSADLLRLRHDWESGRLKKAGENQAEVKLVLEDGSTYALTGKLAFADITVSQSTGTVSLRAIFPNPKGVLLPGMYVRAVLEQGVAETAILVPQRSVSRDAKGDPVVYVLDKDSKVQLRNIQADKTLDGQWVVRQGLNAGDRLVVNGLQKIRPGMPVKIVSTDKSRSTKPI
ncbi:MULTISPECIES: efflux RND transporter periplasmic adaptor subunit [unclassified Methylophilus]|uniref:efflux RND transporter periplasmic adaptor subunit n=1 Tax=unclassified Methylophilus TaxID=2630143 RepID=UPI0023B347BE|nr:efflux RND transporter periplasmic adaptor subunit [Methylophilus sp. YYY-1]MDF0378213.1 efflux RND transporter periplasmic adaptor subunit [Methylophilus sp. YYY-1]BEV07211.1 efflux RND transporter periplasmic adaptor subunit [Methylophilus sp. DW102]